MRVPPSERPGIRQVNMLSSRKPAAGKKLVAQRPSLGPGGMNPIELVLKQSTRIKAYTFDIGGTLAAEDDLSPEIVSALAALVNSGKQVSIVSAKTIKKIRHWTEGEGGLVSQIDTDKRPLFRVYGDRVTKVYSIGESGKMEEISSIPFPASANKDAILRTAERVAAQLQIDLVADESISPEVRRLIAADPLKAKAGDEYIELCSKENLDVKGDKTASQARKMIRERLVAALREEGLLVDELMVVLDGKKGAYVKNKLSDKSGAIKNLQSELGFSADEIVYVGDQFAGGNIADLSVAETGAYCINVGADKEYDILNVYNTEVGPAGTLGFIQAVLSYL